MKLERNWILVHQDVWRTDVLVCWENTPKDWSLYLRKKYNIGNEVLKWMKKWKGEYTGVCFCERKKSSSVIWLRDKPIFAEGVATLAHEAIHSGQHFMKIWYIRQNKYTREVLAAFVDRIVLEVIKFCLKQEVKYGKVTGKTKKHSSRVGRKSASKITRNSSHRSKRSRQRTKG